MASSVQIADGHNNVGGLASLNLLNGTMFAHYAVAEGVLTEWHEYDGWELDGNRFRVPLGLPWVEWVFFQWTRAEMAWFIANFGNEVTIRTLDKGTNTYKNFNATLIKPDLGDTSYDTDFWYDVRVAFRDLEHI